MRGISAFDRLLARRGYLVEGAPDANAAYHAAYLARKFAVLVDLPHKLCAQNVRTVADLIGEDVPLAFYKNPQDLRLFDSAELLVEQFVSYVRVAVEGEKSDDPETFRRMEVYHKLLPVYPDGTERVERKFRIISRAEADMVCAKLADEYCSYTRPWPQGECLAVEELVRLGAFADRTPACRDNIITLFRLTEEVRFAKLLDKKDVVKMSLSLNGEKSAFEMTPAVQHLLRVAAENAQPCPMSKKQAKYFNIIRKKTGADVPRADNAQSPYAIAKKLVRAGDVLGAARVLQRNGSLLLRNLAWLLSRADEGEADAILAMADAKNPVVLMQLIYAFGMARQGELRFFRFYRRGLFAMHAETAEEGEKRRSVLTPAIKEKVLSRLRACLKAVYAARPSLGKIYISGQFRQTGIPLNLSASGEGLDVPPTATRLPLKGEALRIFCYWKGVYDIDASMIVLAPGRMETSAWYNYTEKAFGDALLFSGDCRSEMGAEYYDVRVPALAAQGWKYLIYCLNGYNGGFNEGEVYCGYQNKDDLKTEVWLPQNIAMKIRVAGDSRQYMGFAIDLETRELVVLNLTQAISERVLDVGGVDAILPWVRKEWLGTLNLYGVLQMLGTQVDDPAQADVVFDEGYSPREGQEVVRPWDTPRLVQLLH